MPSSEPQPVDLPEGVDPARMAAAGACCGGSRPRTTGSSAPGRRDGLDEFREQAFRIVGTPAVKRAFDLDARGPRSATATAATRTARASCWPAAWSRRGPAGGTSTGCTSRRRQGRQRLGHPRRHRRPRAARPATGCSSTILPPAARPGALGPARRPRRARPARRDPGRRRRRVRPDPQDQRRAAAATTGRSATRPCSPAAASGAARSTAPATSTPPTSRTTRSPPRTCSPRSTTPSGLPVDTEIRDLEGRPLRITEGEPVLPLFG